MEGATPIEERDKEADESPDSNECSIVLDQSDVPDATAVVGTPVQRQDINVMDGTNQPTTCPVAAESDDDGLETADESIDLTDDANCVEEQYTPILRTVKEEQIIVISLDVDNAGDNVASYVGDSTIDSMEYESAGNVSDPNGENDPDLNVTQKKHDVSLPGCSTSCDSAQGPSTENMNQVIDEDVALDLVTCSICLSEINDPKSLPCLHTFCKTCLEKWDKIRPDDLICPTCQEKCPLPPDGIDGLKGNFFVTKLKDRKNLKRKLSSLEKIPCSACSSGVEANARCVDCDDFLCCKCEEVHSTLRVLKTHRVVKIAELKSGKINLSRMPKQMEQCKKHSGQILWFYCETCCMVICRDCTVVDHCRPEHRYINLEDAIGGQRRKILSVTDDCKEILVEVEASLATLKKHEQRLGEAAHRASEAVDRAADRALADLQACVEVKRKDHHAHIRLINDQRATSIGIQSANFQLLFTRLKTAVDMGQQVTEDGTEFEVASTFPSLMTTLQQLKTTNLPVVRSELSKLSFEINEGPLFTIHELGQIRKYENWERKCHFGHGSTGGKGITKAWAVAVTGDGKVAVANNSSNGVVSVRSQVMPFQTYFTLDTTKGLEGNPGGWKSFPRSVAVASNGHFYVADNTMFVKEYNRDGTYLNQFVTVSPCGAPSNELKITLDYVAANAQDQLLIGPNQYKFIGIHDLSGNHIRSIDVPVEPHFIAAAHSTGEIIVSSHVSNTVHVLDEEGNSLHELTADGVTTWRPRGVCCTKEGEVFVSNALKTKEKGEEASGIYQFTLSGKYLGCVTKDVSVPYGLALSDDDNTLVVGDKRSISIFELK